MTYTLCFFFFWVVFFSIDLLLDDHRQDVDLRDLTGGGLTGAVESSKLAGGSYEDKMNAAPVAAAAAPMANGGGGGLGDFEVFLGSIII